MPGPRAPCGQRYVAINWCVAAGWRSGYVPGGMQRTGLGLLAAIVLAGIAACGDDSSAATDTTGTTDMTDTTGATDPTDEEPLDEPEPVVWPGDGEAEQEMDLGEGLVALLPEQWEVTPLALSDNPERDCPPLEGSLDTGDGYIVLEMHPANCDVEHSRGDQIGNGRHGEYVELEDVPDPLRVEEQDVPAGHLTTFSQIYFEATNSYNEYEDNVGLLELTTPSDPERPTLMLLDSKGELPMDGLVAVAEAIQSS